MTSGKDDGSTTQNQTQNDMAITTNANTTATTPTATITTTDTGVGAEGGEEVIVSPSPTTDAAVASIGPNETEEEEDDEGLPNSKRQKLNPPTTLPTIPESSEISGVSADTITMTPPKPTTTTPISIDGNVHGSTPSSPSLVNSTMVATLDTQQQNASSSTTATLPQHQENANISLLHTPPSKLNNANDNDNDNVQGDGTNDNIVEILSPTPTFQPTSSDSQPQQNQTTPSQNTTIPTSQITSTPNPEVIITQKPPLTTLPSTTITTTDTEIQMTHSTLINPNVSYPHSRHECGVHPFTATPRNSFRSNLSSAPTQKIQENAKYCPKCFCFVCEILASECVLWIGGNHCHAHAKDVSWVSIKRGIQERKKREAAADARKRMVRQRRTFVGGVNTREVIDLEDDDGDDDDDVVVMGSSTASRRRKRTSSSLTTISTTPMSNPYNRGSSSVSPVKREMTHIRGPPSLSPAERKMMSMILHPQHSGGDGMSYQEARRLFLEQEILRARENSSGSNQNSEEVLTEERRRNMKVTDVLSFNFKRILKLSSSTTIAATGSNMNTESSSSSSSAPTAQLEKIKKRRMDGDIPQLCLQNSFYMGGIKIGWPYPVIMTPQRQMALHLIKALQNRMHVILESPTGTGKSAAILCTTLAWQRHYAKTHCKDAETTNVPKIIFCSRTHSQVAQLVESLKKTPYRPRMAILGSRERLCIHRDLRPRGKNDHGSSFRGNLRNRCRVRVRGTEKYRKAMLRSMNRTYEDDDPPPTLAGDGDANASSNGDQGMSVDNDDDDQIFNKIIPTCPHYRQLTSNRTATLAHSAFVPNAKVDCCTTGGSKSKAGAHDIEDLVKFGVNPHVQRGVAIYRKRGSSTFGIKLQEAVGNNGVIVSCTNPGEAAEEEGSLEEQDKIINVNGKSVNGWSMRDVANEIRSQEDPLLLDVVRGHDCVDVDNDDSGYSPHSACPYYLSQELSKHAEIVFAPYQYVLDPKIRTALGIGLFNSVVVLDEAHNIEDTLRDAGSCKFGEVELCELLVMLSGYSIMNKSESTKLDVPAETPDSQPNEKAPAVHVCDAAHSLLLFVERLVITLRQSKDKFENNPGKNGASSAINDYRKFRTPDDKEFEVSYDGPTGSAGYAGRQPVGCKPFFSKLGMNKAELSKLSTYSEALSNYLSSVNSDSEENGGVSTLVDRIGELVSKFTSALKTPEHYYISTVICANGNLDFAAGDAEASDDEGTSYRMKRKPKQIPFIPPRTKTHPDREPNSCTHNSCRALGQNGEINVTRHGSFCDGSTPKWEGFIVLSLLNAGLLMEDLAQDCHSVVLASGTLSPINSLIGELNLLPPPPKSNERKISTPSPSKNNPYTQTQTHPQRRLQIIPKPLEASHVIDLKKQLFAVSIGHFPDGSALKVIHSNYTERSFIHKLGDAIATVVECIPSGGVLVFLPSKSFLRKCINQWDPSKQVRNYFTQSFSQHDGCSTWDRFLASKGKVVVEPTGNQDQFEAAKREYTEAIRLKGGCILLAVFRGKMSEGVSFNDENARGVICVGLPLPNPYERLIKAKKMYNDEQRISRKREQLLSGNEWYNQQAYRAISQALGRCIRHAADFGTVVLMDSRHCNDGAPSSHISDAHKNLPKWMRDHVRNLSKRNNSGHGMDFFTSEMKKEVFGNWPGLKREMKAFFQNAKQHGLDVLSKQQEDLKKAQQLASESRSHVFNATTGHWTMVDAPNRSAATGDHQMSQEKSESNTGISGNSCRDASAATVIEGAHRSEPSSNNTNYKSARNDNKDHNVQTLTSFLKAPQQAASLADETSTSQLTMPTPGPPSTNASEEDPTKGSNITLSQEKIVSPFSQNREEMHCVVCEENEKNTLLLPCRHLCLCERCSKLEKMVDCPLCRCHIKEKIQAYL